MADVIQLKRRSADTTAPSSLAAGELALNTNSGSKRLYAGDGSAVKAYAVAMDAANGVPVTQASANAPTLLTLGASQFVGRGATGDIAACTLGSGLAFTGAALGVDTSTIATKAYVDSVAAGLDPKGSVRVATTAAGTLASSFAAGQTVDGVVLATGNRILIKDQASAIENGIYTVNGAGAPTRATDMAAAASAAGAYTFVEEGTANADSGFVCTSNVGVDVVGTNNLAFSQFSGAGNITAGAGMTKTGNTLDVIAGDSSILVNADELHVQLAATPGLQLSTGLQVKVKANAGITLDANGISLNNSALSTHVVYMGANGLLNGEAAFAYNDTTNVLTVDKITMNGALDGATIDGGTY